MNIMNIRIRKGGKSRAGIFGNGRNKSSD